MQTVLAHGCFDLLHLGHIRHLQEARKYGDRLVVSITDDEHVNKGIGRPHFNAQQRAEALLALACVDEVIVNAAPDAVPAIKRIQPSVYVKGIDYTTRESDAGLLRERAAVEAVGGRLVFTESEKFSSSRLINSEKFSPEVLEYLSSMRIWRGHILRAFELADELRIAFVGERIVDEYQYVQALGKASKEPMLAVVHKSTEQFEGGVMAAAKHAEWRRTEIVSANSFIRKTRLVDADFNRKLFDIYSAQRIELNEFARKQFKRDLREVLRSVDVVVIFDFGHGLIDNDDRAEISGYDGFNNPPFTAINAQTNAGNYGFNRITNYSAADLVCLDVPEARLATGLAENDLSIVMDTLLEGVATSSLLVTHGRFGSHHLDRNNARGHAPALISGGIDTIGAGDATLAAVAPLLAAGLPLKAAAFVGNVAGAIKTSIIGHRRHVGRQELIQTIEALLA
jgi:rfaE bifunctional protein nucleotidyltransferase chain/domain